MTSHSKGQTNETKNKDNCLHKGDPSFNLTQKRSVYQELTPESGSLWS